MRGGSEIGEAEAGTCEPPAMIEQVIEIIEMLRRGPHRLAQHSCVGALAIYQPLSHSLVYHWLVGLEIELDVESFGDAPDFGSKRCISVDHRHTVDCLVEIFDDRLR